MAEYIQGALSAGIFHPHHNLGPITKPSQSMMGGLSLLQEDCPPEQHLKNPVHFTGPWSLFKRGRSCADIVPAQCILVLVVMSTLGTKLA